MLVQFKNTLLGIRPCRESQTGWTEQISGSAQNQNSLELNERAPALKVFWPRKLFRGGRRRGQRGACQRRCLRLMGGLPKKNRAGGSTDGTGDYARFGPLLS